MRRSRISSTLMLVSLFHSNPATAYASTNAIFARQGTCVSGYNQCSGLGLPDNFCCPSTSSCLVLGKNTTLLCCPSGNDCRVVQPITCDISAQNATLHPDNTLKTTALSAKLGTCGSGCCPFGFTCSSANNCIRNAKQDIAPILPGLQNPPSSSSSSLPSATGSTSSSPPISSSTASPNPSATPTTGNAFNPVSLSCNKFPAGAVLVGFFPGLILGVLLTLAGVCIIGARRRKNNRHQSGSSFGNISEPQANNLGMRTDFLRKAPQTPSTTAESATPKRTPTVQRVRSLFQKSVNASQPSPAAPMPLMVQKWGQNHRAPVTPPLQREPSFEDINIFADGDTASALRERERHNGRNPGPGNGSLAPPPHLGDANSRASHQTTFSDMMHRSGLAGLQKGQPYAYKGSPGYSTPRGKIV